MVFFCLQVRVVLKYRHCDGNLCIKVTDNAVVREIHHKYGYSGQLKMGSCVAIWGLALRIVIITQHFPLCCDEI